MVCVLSFSIAFVCCFTFVNFSHFSAHSLYLSLLLPLFYAPTLCSLYISTCCLCYFRFRHFPRLFPSAHSAHHIHFTLLYILHKLLLFCSPTHASHISLRTTLPTFISFCFHVHFVYSVLFGSSGTIQPTGFKYLKIYVRKRAFTKDRFASSFPWHQSASEQYET